MRSRTLLLALVALWLFTAPAEAAEVANHPFIPQRTLSGATLKPPRPYESLCGAAVNLKGDIFLSDYYRHTIEIWRANGSHGEILGVDPGNGPCGLAVDSSDNVYVNSWHGDVVRYTPPYTTSPETIVDGHATGVAIDPVTDDLYVDERTSVALYKSPVEPGEVAMRFGQGSLANGFGVAVSTFAATAGQVYAADAASGTVKVYEPASPDDPVREIDGAGTPQGGFVSLIDSALATDQSNGHLFVADNTQPGFEHPAAAVDEFNAGGLYRGQLPHAIVHGEPVGIAVNESPSARRGEVYVTSGNGSSVVFPPSHETPANEIAVLYGFGPAGAGQELSVATTGSGSGAVLSSPAGINCGATCEAEFNSGATVTLTASAASGSAFSGWSGGCTGTGACQVTMTAAKAVTAEFSPAPVLLSASATANRSAESLEEPTVAFALGRPTARGAGAALPVSAPGAGTLIATGPRIRRVHATVDRAGDTALRLVLNRAGRRALVRSRSGRVETGVRVRFAPRGVGAELVRARTVVFRQAGAEGR